MDSTSTQPPWTSDAAESRRLIAVVYADMVGYSRLMAEDDASTLSRLGELRAELIDPATDRHNGQLVSTAGDSLLLLFDSILSAMRFAIEVQRGVPSFDGDHPPERRIRFRMGVNVGDVVPSGTNLHGEVVNVAARLQSVCSVGAICVSRVVREQVGNRLGLPFKELGALTLKNIGRPVEAYELDLSQAAWPPPKPKLPRRRRYLVAAGALALAATLGLVGWESRPRPPAAVDLGAAAAPAGSPPPLSIAVLPFANLGGDPEQSYLADGIAEDLTTDLAHLSGAFVISRESAFAFRGKSVDIREIGRQLGVRYLLEGSVRRVGASARINAQLIAAETGAHVWAERFDKPLASLGEGQDDIVAHLASALNVKMVNLDAARRVQSGSPAAFDLVLRGRAALNEARSLDTTVIALGLFLQALRADPDSVPAMAGAAAVYAGRFIKDNSLERATQLIAAAEAKAPNSPDVVAAKFILLLREGRAYEAGQAYNRLLDINPSATALILQIGICQCWASPQAALQPLQRTMRLNPMSPNLDAVKIEYARDLLLLDRNEEALAVLEPLQRIWTGSAAASAENTTEPQWEGGAKLLLAIAYVRAGRTDEAHGIIADALQDRRMREMSVRRWLRNIRPYRDETIAVSLRRMAADLAQAGLPDHLDETADSGVPSTAALQDETHLRSPTPMSVPGGRTVLTQEVATLLAAPRAPIVLTTASDSPTIPGALYLQLPASGSLDDFWQTRLERFMRELSHGELDHPIIVFSFNQFRWIGRNLVLRLTSLGYSNVAWYRGGWEAWEASGRPRAPLAGRAEL